MSLMVSNATHGVDDTNNFKNFRPAIPLTKFKPHTITSGFKLSRFISNQTVLVVKGQILDQVAVNPTNVAHMFGKSDIYTEPTTSPFTPQRLEFLVHTLRFLSEEQYINVDGPLLLDTVTLESHNIPVSEEEPSKFFFWQYFRAWSHALKQEPNVSEEISKCCDSVCSLIEKATLNTNYKALHLMEMDQSITFEAGSRVSSAAFDEDRQLGKTHGGLFYSATYGVEEGDAIVALQGADMFYAIRAEGSNYRLVGDVYVQGMMHREVYEGQNPDLVDYDIHLV